MKKHELTDLEAKRVRFLVDTLKDAIKMVVDDIEKHGELTVNTAARIYKLNEICQGY